MNEAGDVYDDSDDLKLDNGMDEQSIHMYYIRCWIRGGFSHGDLWRS
jgi:hypothetical protein